MVKKILSIAVVAAMTVGIVAAQEAADLSPKPKKMMPLSAAIPTPKAKKTPKLSKSAVTSQAKFAKADKAFKIYVVGKGYQFFASHAKAWEAHSAFLAKGVHTGPIQKVTMNLAKPKAVKA